MEWRGRRQSDNVEDQRGQGGSGGGFRLPVGGKSGGGLSGIIILVVLFFALKACGIDPMQILAGGDGSAPGGQITQQQSGGAAAPANDEMKQFVSTVLAETEDTWKGIFKAQGQTYREPTLVLFFGQVRSACGFASVASGPFYCPGDQKLYLDTSFFSQLDRQFGAKGDFAEAYVIAHEVGHHVQNLIGVLPRFNQMRQTMSEAESNQMSIRVELQADCFAGIWANATARKGILDQGDLEEALNAATKIGDDNIQKRTQGYVVPESFNHGTSQQRYTWLRRGIESGKLEACDTFNNPI